MYNMRNIYNGIMYRFWELVGRFNSIYCMKPKVLSGIETIDLIIAQNLSLARLGDGEFNLIFGKGIGFQKENPELAKALKKVLQEAGENQRLLIGIPGVFSDLDKYRYEPQRFWHAYLGKNRKKITAMLKKNYVYADTNVTRFYTGFHSKAYHEIIINRFKQLWKGRNVVIVEGEKTRMGVGNNFFDEANSIRRILCPATNAFSRRHEIIEEIQCHDIGEQDLLILALGPTATILANDLCHLRYQALDLGHLDLQYEYFLRQSSNRIKIAGKYTNEAVGGEEVDDSIVDKQYLSQIISIIS